MQGPSVVGQTDAGLHAAPAPPAEGVAGLARHGGPSDFARRALRGSHYKDHTRAIASNNSCPVWPRPPLPTRGCLLKAPELLHPTQIPTRADAAPKLVIDHEHRNHRTSLAAPCAARIVKTRRGPPFQQQPPQKKHTHTEKSERTEEIMARTKVQPKRGSKLRMEARPINARQRLNGGETVRKGRCPLNPAPPGALAGAKARQSCSNGGETVRKGRCPLNPALPGAFRSQRPDPPSPLLPPSSSRSIIALQREQGGRCPP